MIKKYFLLLTILSSLFIFSYSNFASAADEPDRFVSDATVLDANKLKAGLREVYLWGIKPIRTENSMFQLQAIEKLDSIIKNDKISCKPIAEKFPKVIARCISVDNTDLGLELISDGLAIIDREQIDSSDIARIYNEAQTIAKKQGKGVWEYLSTEKKKDDAKDTIAKFIANDSLVKKSIAVGSVALLSILALLLWVIRSMNSQKDEMEKIYIREQMIKSKEKGVILSLIRTELEDNKTKVIAFTRLYETILDDIEGKSDDDAHKILGNSLKKAPILKRDVFDLHLNNVALLDLNIAHKLSEVYSKITKDDDFITLSDRASVNLIKSMIGHSLGEAIDLKENLEKVINLLDIEYLNILDSVNKYELEQKTK